MGMYPTKKPDNCPGCGASWLDLDVEVKVPEVADEDLYRQCPVCGERFHRWDMTNVLRSKAEVYVKDEEKDYRL